VVPERLLETHLARVLFSAQRRGRTGVLSIDQGVIHTRLKLVDGRVVFAEAGTLSETLGRLLMRNGVIDRDEYLLILERMGEPSPKDEVLRFGEVAIQMGMLSASDLSEALELQVRLKLQHCLQLDDADWRYCDDESSRKGAPFPAALEPALRAALREDPQPYRWVGRLMSMRHFYIRLGGDSDVVGRRFHATPEELRFLKEVDGEALGDVLQSRAMEPTEIGALLAALLFADLLALEPDPPKHRANQVAPPPVEARRAPRPKIAAPPEPGSAERPSEASAPNEPSADLAKLDRAREAADRLRDEMRRRGKDQPTSQRERIEAERAFEQGRKLLAVGGTNKALEHFAKAASLMGEAVEYLLHLRWCEFLVEADELLKPVRDQELRGTLLEALRQNRKMGFAHYVQGRLSLLDEDLASAEKCFLIATRLEPGDVESQRYLMLVRRRRG
jgi:hypothetical protein